MLDEIIKDSKTDVSYNKSAWINKKRSQLNNAYKLSSEMALKLSDPNVLQTYFDVQSRFDKLSVNNALLITAQYPQATQLKEYNVWKEEQAVFKRKYPKKIIILEPSEAYINSKGESVVPFNPKEVIDISETNCIPTPKLYDKKIILQGLLHNCSAEIKPVDGLESGRISEWNREENTIYVCRGNDYDKIINSVATEIAKMNYFENVGEISDERANCIAYMLCRKYGIQSEINNIQTIANSYDKKASKDIKDDLSSLKYVLDDMNNAMSQYLGGKYIHKNIEQER